MASCFDLRVLPTLKGLCCVVEWWFRVSTVLGEAVEVAQVEL